MNPNSPIYSNVVWTPLPPPSEPNPDGIPHATHSGVIEVYDMKLKCYQLSNGQRVIDAADMMRIFKHEKTKATN